MQEVPSTTIRVRQDIRRDLARIARDLSRKERRRVTMGETVDRLMTAWRQVPAREDPAHPGRPE